MWLAKKFGLYKEDMGRNLEAELDYSFEYMTLKDNTTSREN